MTKTSHLKLSNAEYEAIKAVDNFYVILAGLAIIIIGIAVGFLLGIL